jgi:hypothetical protein
MLVTFVHRLHDHNAAFKIPHRAALHHMVKKYQKAISPVTAIVERKAGLAGTPGSPGFEIPLSTQGPRS